MKNNIAKAVMMFASACVLVGIGVIIGININIDRKKPVMPYPQERAWYMECSEEGVLVDDNFWRFARASYVLIGTPPECEFYKIVSEVPRNDFVQEQFYIEDGDDKMYYHAEDGTRISTLAIDVSAYQPYIDWEAVKDAGVEIAMLRVGYRGYESGALVVDDMFEKHIEGATAAGIQVGVYFFTQATSYEEGAEEAQFVLDTIRRYKVTCPVAIDTEALDIAEARTYNLDNTARTDSVVGFCETIKAAGYVPMIYSNRNWFVQKLDMTRLGEYKLWLAHYANQPDFPYDYVGWQYTGEGQLDGIDGSVDLDVWFQ
ncbi:MAG: glycoside hydrolase family 25 protein [Wujia sp.]